MKLFKKKWFVGVLTLSVAGSRFFRPPWKVDWEGSVGTFDSEQKAEEFVAKVKARYPDYLDESRRLFGVIA